MADAKIRCPWCAEEILVAARKCKHCGELLDAPDGAPTGPAVSPGGEHVCSRCSAAFATPTDLALHTAQVHPEPTPRPASQPDLTPEGIAARGEKKNDTSAGIGCLVIVVIVVVLVALGSLLGGDDGDDGGGGGGGGSNDRQVDEVTAYEACKSSVESQLRAPGTASFPDYFDQDGEVVITGSGSSLTVSSHVDAENAFGGEVRTQWACDATRTSDGWRGVAMLL